MRNCTLALWCRPKRKWGLNGRDELLSLSLLCPFLRQPGSLSLRFFRSSVFCKELNAFLHSRSNRAGVVARDFDRLHVQFLLLGQFGQLFIGCLEVSFLISKVQADRAFEALGKSQ